MQKTHLLTFLIFVLFCHQKLVAQNDNTRVLTLDEVFSLALENSKQLRVYNAEIEAASNATEVIKNSRMPSVGISLSASYLGDALILNRDFTNSTTASMPHFGNNFSIEASQIIFSGGAISNNISKAELNEQIAQLNFQKQQMDIRFLLVGSYLDLYKLMNQRKVYVKNIEQTKLLIEQTKAKQQQGMALNNDITRHELVLQNIELAMIEIDNNCKILNNQLVTTLGLPDSIIVIPDTTIVNKTMSLFSEDELYKVAEQQLPQLKTADIDLQLAEKDIKIAKAGYLPSLALVAANYFDGPITIEVPTIDKNLNYWYVGIGLKYNLGSLYTSHKSVVLARSQQKIANHTKDLLLEQSRLSVQSSLIKYQESFDKMQSIEKSFQLATENYGVINNRYLNNLVLITEMLDASNTKLNAELQVVNAKINIVFNYYKLQHTIGKI